MILPGFKYLVENRKLTEQTIRTFNLGYHTAEGETYIGAEFTGTLPTLPATMRNSTIFPIIDTYGTCVAVSARSLDSKPNTPKYINTVFEKAKNLYGINVTWRDMLREQSVYVVEGNFSLLVPWQNGVKNIVAMLGSNLSLTQIALLNRFVKKVVFVSDKDKAGERFIEKMRLATKQKFYDSDIEFFYKDLSQGSDPDDYFTKLGGTLEEFKALPEKELNYGR
jgi:DNA primase